MDGYSLSSLAYEADKLSGKYVNSYPMYYLEKPPRDDGKGLCKVCRKLDILGDGLCQSCWDNMVGAKNTDWLSHLFTKCSKSNHLNNIKHSVTQSQTKRIKHLTNDIPVAERQKKVGGWSKGLKKEQHPSLMRISEKMKGKRNRLGWKKRPENL